MDLNERKKKILQAVIDEYIDTAEPVGSRAVSKNHELGLSSATIRNEMADLEEMGYLIQPHTSAGRVPSDEGYRFYVNSLMTRYRMGVEAIEQLQSELGGRLGELDKVIRKAGFIASALTDYTAFVVAPGQETAALKRVELISLGGGRATLIAVTQNGVVRNRIFHLDISDEETARLSAILDEKLSGLTVAEIDFEKINEIEAAVSKRLALPAQVLVGIMNFVYDTISGFDNAEIFVDNAKSILKYPEYNDVSKAREIFGFLENKENIRNLVSGSSGEGIQVRIGSENDNEALRDCSLVTVNYSLGDRAGGKLGIIGPKRMDYAKVFASLDLISANIDKILQMYADDGNETQ